MPTSTVTVRPLRRIRAPQLLGLLRTFDEALADLDDTLADLDDTLADLDEVTADVRARDRRAA
jgi:ABC-type transporter Mla subunit MlaD